MLLTQLPKEFKEFFSQENDLVFCNNVCSVIEALGHQHNPTEWCLCIDSSKDNFFLNLIFMDP